MKIPVVVAVTKPANAPAANAVATVAFKARADTQEIAVTKTVDDSNGTTGYSWTDEDGNALELEIVYNKVDLSSLNLIAGVYAFKYNEWYEKDGARSMVQSNDVKVVVFPESITWTTESPAISESDGTVDITVTGLPQGITVKSAAGDGTKMTASTTVAGNKITATASADGTGTVTVTLIAETKDQDGYEISVAVSGQ